MTLPLLEYTRPDGTVTHAFLLGFSEGRVFLAWHDDRSIRGMWADKLVEDGFRLARTNDTVLVAAPEVGPA